ncbi:cytochrome-c oxidase, cbb3-type subunit III [Reinekea marina]|uniref:Cbb3-type cytochrome c oxidase subunit n=1 Tax=Reinekea marina TaxID=1310421 RepID=A0ABV7WSL2_9GAMM|nr:cytochrome-c oxidase, cbb3-type subunit III [Reinekea marina]MBU2863031.1 cytochrome-c oxidase, cbb3-type subunit III [Reinekea forsetii]MDN3650286.1 cytochrome-c oxidase, cbb3-type subunit III [Reinekea marina]
MSSFWNAYIFVLTGIFLLGIIGLIYFTRRMPGDDKIGETTGHKFDDIEEYNNPMPKWWLNLFYITIVFAVGYMIYYPVGNWEGISKWTSANQLEAETAAYNEKYGDIYLRFLDTPVEELQNNAQAKRIGQRLFVNNCSLCHGQNAQGYYGFPNLTDNDWLYGSDADQIKHSINFGRMGQMPAWKDTLGTQGVSAVTEYVLSISGNEYIESQAKKGEVIYQQMCVACHGAQGQGNIALGAPNLTNNIWLYDLPEQELRRDIMTTVMNGRAGNMPAWKDILGEEKVHLVSGYVYSLRN